MFDFEENFSKGLSITILNVSVDIIPVLFFKLLSMFEKLHSKFKSLFIEKLNLP